MCPLWCGFKFILGKFASSTVWNTCLVPIAYFLDRLLTVAFYFLYAIIFQFSRSVVSDSLRPYGLQHTRPPCPSPTPGVYLNSCPLSRWCHPTISSFVIPFSTCLQSFPAPGAFQMSQFFTSGGPCIGVLASASVLPMNTQDWFPFGWTAWIPLLSIFIINHLIIPIYWRKM